MATALSRTTRYLPTLIVLSVATPAMGDGIDDLSIEWSSPAGCGTRSQVVSTLVGMLGDRWEGSSSQRFKGTVEALDERWRTTLVVITGDDTYRRTVTVNTCETATAVVALLIGLALDPTHILASEDEALQDTLETLETASQTDDDEAEPPAPEPETPEEPEPKPEPQPEDETVPPPPPETSPRTSSFRVGLSFSADVATASPFSPGIAIDGGAQIGLFAAGLTLRYAPPRGIDIAGNDDGVYRPQLLSIALGAGARFAVKRFRIAPLLGFATHGVFAQSEGVEQPRDASVWLFSVWGAVGFDFLIGDHLGIDVTPALHVMLNRPRFNITGIGVVHQPGVVAGVFQLGVFLRF